MKVLNWKVWVRGVILGGMLAGPASLARAGDQTDSVNSGKPARGTPSGEDLEREMVEMRRMIERQNQVIDRLQQKLDERDAKDESVSKISIVPVSAPSLLPIEELEATLDHRISGAIEKYDDEKAKSYSMPRGVQTGYSSSSGFYIKSINDPKWDNWDGDSKIPFELRLRGRLQLAYYGYHTQDTVNHQTGKNFSDAFGGVHNEPDLNALEVKRARLIFEGTAFEPDLRYRIQLNGDTRGLGGFYNNNHIASGSPATGGSSAVEGGGVTIDHAVRLFEGWVAYDFHGCPVSYCDDPCNPHVPNYRPTYTLIGGKLKLLGPLEEYLGSGNEQFVEFSAASWMFSPDDDNLANAVGFQGKMDDDRLYWVAFVTNGSESNFAANQIDNLPGFNIGAWYDFGGTWDEKKKKWQLFGDSMSDIDGSPNPVLRVGGAANMMALNHRALYGDAEQSRFRTVDGGARVIDVFNGAGNAANAVDRFDAYTFNVFAAAKHCGFSISNEWWCRVLTDFDTVPTGNGVIRYKDGAGGTNTFDKESLVDFGMQLQGGYFVCPGTLELVARWSSIWGESGNINGGFDHNESFNEYTVGINWFMHRHQLKWSTDFGIYDGGNPANASAAGFLTNRDGWLMRSQVQLAF